MKKYLIIQLSNSCTINFESIVSGVRCTLTDHRYMAAYSVFLLFFLFFFP